MKRANSILVLMEWLRFKTYKSIRIFAFLIIHVIPSLVICCKVNNVQNAYMHDMRNIILIWTQFIVYIIYASVYACICRVIVWCDIQIKGKLFTQDINNLNTNILNCVGARQYDLVKSRIIFFSGHILFITRLVITFVQVLFFKNKTIWKKNIGIESNFLRVFNFLHAICRFSISRRSNGNWRWHKVIFNAKAVYFQHSLYIIKMFPMNRC